MSELLLGSIDLTKIDKKYIVSTDKNGQPFKNGAKYINIAVWVNNEADKYGNHASIQMGNKDNKIYIGNLKKYQKPQSDNDFVEVASDNDDELQF